MRLTVSMRRVTIAQVVAQDQYVETNACAALLTLMGAQKLTAAGGADLRYNLSSSFGRVWWRPSDYCDYCACDKQDYGVVYAMPVAADSKQMAPTQSESAAPSSEPTQASDYSGTNNQVEGVDEADLIKTDGKYLYILPRTMTHLIIADAYPVRKASILSKTTLRNSSIQASDMLISGGLLVMFGTSQLVTYDGSENLYVSVAQLWNVTDRARPWLLKSVEVEGYITGSARLVGAHVYWVVTTYPQYEWPVVDPPVADPAFSDSGPRTYSQPVLRRQAPLIRQLSGKTVAAGEASKTPFRLITTCSQTSFVEGLEPGSSASWTTILSMSLSNGNLGEVQTVTQIGSGYVVYVSENSVYVAGTNWNYAAYNVTSATDSKVMLPSWGQWTVVLKFDYSAGAVAFSRLITVPGSVLNQYCMDEFEGKFRIATTWGWTWDGSSSNNVFVYSTSDGSKVGEIVGLAPGESIKSVRFMGASAFVVTFRQVDPLFVLDLSDPTRPAVRGELKIPGWSDYLHPVNKTHLIGLGKDTEAKDMKICTTSVTWEGSTPIYSTTCEIQTRVVVNGIKLSLFDVTIPERPLEAWTQSLGGPGSYSIASHDPHAFLFHGNSGLLALPARLSPPDQYYTTFDGLLVFRLAAGGLRLEGNVSHHDSSAGDGASWYWGETPKSVYRAVYMDNVLWTVSDRRIQAHNVAPATPVAMLVSLNGTEPNCDLDPAPYWGGIYFPGRGIAMP